MHKQIEIRLYELLLYHISVHTYKRTIDTTLCGITGIPNTPSIFHTLFSKDSVLKKYSKYTWMCEKCIKRL